MVDGGCMTEQFWWYLARSSGLVAWALLCASLVWGVLLATRVLKPHDKPGWLLDLHRWLGTLTAAMVGVHLLALVVDSFVDFDALDLLVPFASDYATFPVALGVVALYLLIAVQVSSFFMRRIPTRWWRLVHMSSYVLVLATSWHAVLAGTDVVREPYLYVAVVLSMVPAVALLVRWASPPIRRSSARRAQSRGAGAEPATTRALTAPGPAESAEPIEGSEPSSSGAVSASPPTLVT
jgi:DMSO/TMAO reductase YedYZ heme-binding membrane subunit